MNDNALVRTLRRSGWLILAGLAVEALTLALPASPRAFFLFLVGGGMMLLGSLLFLWRLARQGGTAGP